MFGGKTPIMQTGNGFSQAPNAQHILLTSLGKQARKTEYGWKGKRVTAELTPLALVQLLDEPQLPNRVVTVITEGARETTWPTFRKEICRILGFEPERVDIPDGSTADDILQILESVANKIPKDAQLALDVTQGLRHFPFIFYALVLYLKSLRGVKVCGVYYGMIEGLQLEVVKPIIDLQPLLELPEWFYAVRMFREHGTTSPIAALLQPLAAQLDEEASALFKAHNRQKGQQRRHAEKQVGGAVEALKKYAFAYEAALPLELGKASWEISERIQELAAVNASGIPPLAAELTGAIAAAAQRTALAAHPPGKGHWKTQIPLDEKELERQAGMIDVYLRREQLPLAVGLMREWVVSWAILRSENRTERWLDNQSRRPYEQRLGALGAFARNQAFRDIITQKQRDFGEFWNRLTGELRNALHHHGMRENAVEKPIDSLEKVKDFWERLKAGNIPLPGLGGGKGTLLLSPQGTRPGVLFSALKAAQPDTCLVICSKTTACSIPEAAAYAAFKGEIEPIELADPHGGYSEICQTVEKARRALLDADKVVANMTGGTTLMGLVIQQMTEEAQNLDRPTRRFALVDRRPPAEQDAEPYVQGGIYWLDETKKDLTET